MQNRTLPTVYIVSISVRRKKKVDGQLIAQTRLISIVLTANRYTFHNGSEL